jgi:hypothetical protein
MNTVYEVYGLNKQAPGRMRCTKITYYEPVEIHINGKVVFSSFPDETGKGDALRVAAECSNAEERP